MGRDEYIQHVAMDIQSKLPTIFDMDTIYKKFVLQITPTTVVLLQELERFNLLIDRMLRSLMELQRVGCCPGSRGMGSQARGQGARGQGAWGHGQGTGSGSTGSGRTGSGRMGSRGQGTQGRGQGKGVGGHWVRGAQPLAVTLGQSTGVPWSFLQACVECVTGAGEGMAGALLAATDKRPV